MSLLMCNIGHKCLNGMRLGVARRSEMTGRRNRDGQSSVAVRGRAPRRPGTKAGLNSDELGARLGYSGALIRSIESGHRAPQPDFARRADGFFGYPKIFEKMEARLRDLPFPPSYRPFVPHERAARVLRMFEVTLIPGLFQTPEYARAMLAARPHATPDEVENLVAARLARQEILDGEDASLVYAVLDEAALHRPVGGAKVMRDQLEHLAALSRAAEHHGAGDPVCPRRAYRVAGRAGDRRGWRRSRDAVPG